jgi:hypothetical protein
MLSADRHIAILDYFRVPYSTDVEDPLRRLGTTALRWGRDGSATRVLSWPRENDAQPRRYAIGSRVLFAAVASDEQCRRLLADASGRWERAIDIDDEAGVRRSSVWRDDSGNLFIPFDPNRSVELLLAEKYLTGRGGFGTAARAPAAALYYRVRPVLPRAAQIAARRIFSRAQGRATFPGWPVEPALHDLYDLFLDLVRELAQEPVPYIAPWPKPFTWALVLTHDVETKNGYDNLSRLRDIEEALDLRSSWNFVARRYDVDDAVVEDLWNAGHEVGVHGLYHDGRDLESRAVLEKRLPEMAAHGRRWKAVGFRSPALRRSFDLMPLLGFDYDSSYPDTDPYGPDGGGCCSWLPYTIGDLVELPVTVPQDHTLFEILHQHDGRAWHEKTEYLRGRGGMALMITHPDYMGEPARQAAYADFLRTFASDAAAWKPLPREISAWWRRRSHSRLERVDGGWKIVGHAADEGQLASIEPGHLARPASHA